MPPKGTVVINKIRASYEVKMLGGKTYFTVDDLEKIKVQNPQLYGTIQQLIERTACCVVSDVNPFVISGTLGELFVIDPQQLANQYAFMSGNGIERINQQSLNRRLNKDGYMTWTNIQTLPDNTVAWACHVPISKKGEIPANAGKVYTGCMPINQEGVSHGKGDFVIALDTMGRPDLQRRYVLNGDIFATTYNNQGKGK